MQIYSAQFANVGNFEIAWPSLCNFEIAQPSLRGFEIAFCKLEKAHWGMRVKVIGGSHQH